MLSSDMTPRWKHADECVGGSPRRLADLVVVDAQGSAQPLEHVDFGDSELFFSGERLRIPSCTAASISREPTLLLLQCVCCLDSLFLSAFKLKGPNCWCTQVVITH